MEGTSSDDGLGIMHTLRDLVLFISCYLALNLQNDLVVLALHNGDCHYLYESPKSKLRRGVRVQPPVSDVCKEIITRIFHIFSSPLQSPPGDVPSSGSESPLAAGLSMALCHIQRLGTGSCTGLRQIFCLLRSPVSQRQYIPMMNVIFAAQQAFVTIDSYSLCDMHSDILEQAANMTNGLHRKLQKDGELGQHLLTFSSWSQTCRHSLLPGKQCGVDFKTFCFCHKKTLQRGFVCSACLSISCVALKSGGDCMTCAANFDTRS